VSVYGPPVNLAARLESLTKRLRVPVLLDRSVSARLRGTAFGVRRLARVRPEGFSRAHAISELYEPTAPGTLSDDERGDYDVALDHFCSGAWPVARRKLERLRDEAASHFLLSFLDDHPSGPPEGWDGVIPLDAK
jgi:adenylate cyclase